VGYLLVYDTTCSLRANRPALAVEQVYRWLCHTAVTPILSVRTQVIFWRMFSARYNPHWLPIHDEHTYNPRSTRFDVVSSPHREHVFGCPIRSLSVLRLHVLRPCIRGTGRCDRTPTCGVSCCRPSPVGSRTSSGQLTASVPTPRSTHSVMMVSERTWKKCVSRSASFLRAHVDLLDGPFYLPCRTLNA